MRVVEAERVTNDAKKAEPETVIYDFGSNNGDDIPYYLLKADKVVAVEANPALARMIADRFPKEISSGRLVLENVAVTEEDDDEPIAFYVHRRHHVLSTVLKPQQSEEHNYDKILVPTIAAPILVAKHGLPFYIKIDLEGFDIIVLRALFQQGVRPHQISVEGHDAAALGMLAAMGGYKRFKIVRGYEIGRVIAEATITDRTGTDTAYRFPVHSAGPFGEDIRGPWLNSRDFFRVLQVEGLGWYDIHAQYGPEPGDFHVKIPLAKALKLSLKLAFPDNVSHYYRTRVKLRSLIRKLRPIVMWLQRRVMWLQRR